VGQRPHQRARWAGRAQPQADALARGIPLRAVAQAAQVAQAAPGVQPGRLAVVHKGLHVVPQRQAGLEGRGRKGPAIAWPGGDGHDLELAAGGGFAEGGELGTVFVRHKRLQWVTR
jgi:hypothetical protein